MNISLHALQCIAVHCSALQCIAVHCSSYLHVTRIHMYMYIHIHEYTCVQVHVYMYLHAYMYRYMQIGFTLYTLMQLRFVSFCLMWSVCVSIYTCIWRASNPAHLYIHVYILTHTLHIKCIPMRGIRGEVGGLGSRPKKMYGERLGDGVEYHLMSPTPRR